ncbi:transcription termination factor 4, mitochondrial-like [Babylonia areolata]|uniref:transcription termination factor 4, mitochondrial-like n=1 Tax=Babylonia areolata TaxID=304850 RepID=UPI003FD633D6
MHFSRRVLSVNQGRWRQVIPLMAGQCCQAKQALLGCVSHNWKTSPLQVVNRTQHSRCRTSCGTRSEQSRCAGELLAPPSTPLRSQGNLPCLLSHAEGCLLLAHRTGLQTSVRFLHSGEGRGAKHSTDVPQTEMGDSGGRENRQMHIVSESEEASGRQETEDGTQAVSTETDDEVKQLTRQIMKAAGQKDVMVSSFPLPQVEKLVEGLRQCGWQSAHILSLLSTHPSFLHHRRSLLPNVQLLSTLGFEVREVRAIVESLPLIAQTPKSQILQAMDALRDLGFGEDTVFRAVSSHPPLLLASRATLSERVTALRQLFKSADVVALVMKCPRLLTDPWKEVKAKFDYVFHQMGVTQKQMLHAALFNHSLSYIQQRHTFLVRAGFFSTAKRQQGERSPNARLDQIITSSDKEFCRRFGNFDVAEYRVFCRMLDKEKALRDVDSDDDD